jgi:hypothetical protein
MRLAILTHALSATAITVLAFSGSAFAQNLTNFTFPMVPTDGVEACIRTAAGRVTITHTPLETRQQVALRVRN